jgi:hypothetical protein
MWIKYRESECGRKIYGGGGWGKEIWGKRDIGGERERERERERREGIIFC